MEEVQDVQELQNGGTAQDPAQDAATALETDGLVAEAVVSPPPVQGGTKKGGAFGGRARGTSAKGACHKCSAEVKDESKAAVCESCHCRYHIFDCGSRIAISGHDTSCAKDCPRCTSVCLCGGGKMECHTGVQKKKRHGEQISVREKKKLALKAGAPAFGEANEFLAAMEAGSNKEEQQTKGRGMDALMQVALSGAAKKAQAQAAAPADGTVAALAAEMESGGAAGEDDLAGVLVAPAPRAEDDGGMHEYGGGPDGGGLPAPQGDCLPVGVPVEQG